MRTKRAAMFGLALAIASGPGCSDDDESDQPILVVQAAGEQPGSDELGVIVSIQSRGGKWLELEVSGGTLANGSHGTCMLAPTAASLRENVVNVLVFPARVEAVVTVRLLPNGTHIENKPAGAGQGGVPDTSAELGPCKLDVASLKEVIRPVQRVAPLPPTTGSSGSGGTAGSSGGAGTAGGSAGTAGSGGVSGDAGSGGTGGTAGTDDSGGSAGSSGSSNIGGTGDGGTSGASGSGGAT